MPSVSAKTIEYVGQVTRFAGASTTIDDIVELIACCVRVDAPRSVCGTVLPAEVWTRGRCPDTVTKIEHNVCYREKASNAWHRQETQETGNTYNRHKLFTFTFTFTNDRQQAHLKDLDPAQGTIERAARESSRITPPMCVEDTLQQSVRTAMAGWLHGVCVGAC